MRSLALLLLFAATAAASAASGETDGRFYFSGDGVLSMGHAHFAGETLNVRYRDAAGRYDAAAIETIRVFFRSRSDGESGPLSLRLIELIDYAGDQRPGSRMTLVSGYRSPELNQSLRDGGRRVAQASLHTEGVAADVAFRGTDLRRLWLELREDEVGGVGLYRKDGFLHLDTGKARFWEPATSAVEQNLSAENARVFARTDYDRYATLEGAVIRLHSLTALPIRIAREARLGGESVELIGRGEGVVLDGDCWVFAAPAATYELVVASATAPPAKRAPIALRTCAPRLGATAAEIATNPVEIWTATTPHGTPPPWRSNFRRDSCGARRRLRTRSRATTRTATSGCSSTPRGRCSRSRRGTRSTITISTDATSAC